jgi:type I restriction enzyme S subunit
MSKNWPVVRLGEVLKQDMNYVDQLEPKMYPKLSVRLYGRGVALDSPTDGAAVRMRRHQLAKAGQVILSEIWAKKGAIGIVPNVGTGALVTSHFFLFDICETRLFPGYMAWLLKGNYFERNLWFEARGTTGYAAIRPKQFLALEIPLPPLDEQRRIVARIEQLTAKVEQAEILRQQSLTEAISFVSSLHLNLANGRIVRLDQVLALDEEREEIKPGKSYPQVGIRGYGKGLFPKAEVNATETTYRWFNRLYEGALVLSQVKGWEGAIAVCPSSLAGWYASPEYRTFRLFPEHVSPEYLSAVIATPWFWMQLKQLHKGIGARRQRTRPEQFLQMRVPMPTLDRQEQALKMFANIEVVKQHQADTAARLQALLPSILDKAFKGEM